MAKPEKYRRSRMTRSQRVERGGNLVMASMISAVAFLGTLVLAVLGVVSGSIALLLLLVTAALGFAAYRMVR